MKEYARGWTTEYRGLGSYYLGLELARRGETEAAAQVLAMAFADIPIDRIADAIANLGQPRPTPAVLRAGKTAPGNYELRTLEGETKTVTMSEALLELEEGHILLLCLLSSYRANGPYNDFLQRYRSQVRDFKPFLGPLHVITEVKDRYPDRPHYFETEDKLRAETLPFELLFDPNGEVSQMYGPQVSPCVMALDGRGRIRSEGDLDGPQVWKARPPTDNSHQARGTFREPLGVSSWDVQWSSGHPPTDCRLRDWNRRFRAFKCRSTRGWRRARPLRIEKAALRAPAAFDRCSQSNAILGGFEVRT